SSGALCWKASHTGSQFETLRLHSMTTKAPASVAVQSSGNQGFHPRTVFYLLLILFACAATPLSAQQTLVEAPSRASGPQTFTNVDWFERELGDGVVWRHYLFDDLDGLKQSISYIEADLSNPNVSVEFPYLANAR